MKIHFCLKGIDEQNVPTAQLREACRMACIAWNLADLGNEVTLDAPDILSQHARWKFFSHLKGTPPAVDVLVVPSELRERPKLHRNTVVSIKTTKHPHDAYSLENCDLLCNFPCHRLWETEDRGEYKEFMINKLGQEGFDLLMLRANTYKKRDDKMTELILNEMLKELE